MMKRKILAVTIPVVGCITVVGTGFSAWYFGEAASSSDGLSASLNTHVTEKIESMGEGVLTFTASNKDEVLNDKYLILDQGGVDNIDPTVGIMIADSELNETVADPVEDPRKYEFTVTFDGRSSGLTLNKLYDAKMELSVSVEIDLSDKLFQYVTLVDKEPNKASMKVLDAQPSGSTLDTVYFNDTDGNHIWTATYTLKADKLDDLSTGPISQFAWKFEIDLSTNADLRNSLFRYAGDDVDNTKPKNGGDYDNMVTALGLGEVGTPATLDFATTAKIGAAA